MNRSDEELQGRIRQSFKRVDKRRIGGKSYFHVVANPMKKNTTPYREWQRGWEAGYFESLMKAAN